MKKLFITTLFFVFTIIKVFSQSVELQSYCFGNYNHNLINNLSLNSLIKLKKVLQENNVDTSTFYRIKYDEVFLKFTTKEYLSNHAYKYIKWTCINNTIKESEYISFNGFNIKTPNKLIIIYSTDNKNIENLSIYILN